MGRKCCEVGVFFRSDFRVGKVALLKEGRQYDKTPNLYNELRRRVPPLCC